MLDYELIDHTADIGIRVFADSLESLFTKAAAAMFDVMLENALAKEFGAKKTFQLELNAANLEELFVRWLSELLSLADCEDVVFKDFQIKKLAQKELSATVKGVARHYFKFKMEIKAVTYHNLKITQHDGRYQCEVIFDV